MPARLSDRLRAIGKLPLRRCAGCGQMIVLVYVEKDDAAFLDTCPCRPSGRREVRAISWLVVDQLKVGR